MSDFAYLLKSLTGDYLPDTVEDFNEIMKIYFPNAYDIKYLINENEIYKGGLNKIAKELNIERSDIQGCLNFNAPQWDIILYDSTAGGAGQIRRLAQEDGIKLHSVIRTALEIIDGCDCSPSCYSCLRNYYNQKIHDLLNRQYAFDFLENYAGELEAITENEKDLKLM